MYPITSWTVRSLAHLYYIFFFFFFNDTATTEIYTLSLHDALPISFRLGQKGLDTPPGDRRLRGNSGGQDRKSTRLNSSHANISYAVFCLKKKKKQPTNQNLTHTKSQQPLIINHIYITHSTSLQ